MSDTVERLLGPNHNRLVTVVDDPRQHLGQVNPATAKSLRTHGWTPYIGPARANRGWVIPGTDENVRPRPIRMVS